MNIEDLLREAAPGANDLYLAGLPDPKDCHHTVSKRFERKMKKLLKRQKSPVLYWVQRSVACFLLVVLLGGTTVLTFSAEARAAFFGWVREVFETHFSYTFTGEEAEIPEDVIYSPTWLPEGYSVVAEPKPGKQATSVYADADGNLITFVYTMDTEMNTTQIVREGIEAISVFVGETPADFYYDDEPDASSILVWVGSDKKAVFWISAALDVDELIKIAESIEAQKIN